MFAVLWLCCLCERDEKKKKKKKKKQVDVHGVCPMGGEEEEREEGGREGYKYKVQSTSVQLQGLFWKRVFCQQQQQLRSKGFCLIRLAGSYIKSVYRNRDKEMPPSIPTPSPQQLPPRSFHTILPPYPHHKPRLLPLVLNPSAASTKIQAQNNTHNRNKEAIKHIEIPFLLFPPHWRERKARGNVNQMKNETERECIVIKQRILEESLGKPWILGTDPETKAKIPSLQNQKYTAKTKIGQATRGENSKKPSPIRKPPLAMPIKHKARQDHMKVVRKEATSAKTSRGSQEFSASDSRSQETSISRQQIDSKRLYDAAPSSSMLQTDLDSPPALEIAAFTKTSMNTTEDENGANVFRHSSLDSHHEQITSDTSNDSASVASTAQASNSTSVIETSEKTGSIPSSAAKTSSPDSNDQIASQNAKTEARSRLRAEDAIDAKSRTIGKKSEKTQMATKKPIVVQTSVITGKRGAGKSITGMQLALLHTELGRIVIPVNMKEEAYGKRRYEILEDGLLQTERRELTADIVRLNMELLNKVCLLFGRNHASK